MNSYINIDRELNIITNKEKQLLEKYQKLDYTEMFNDFMPISLKVA